LGVAVGLVLVGNPPAWLSQPALRPERWMVPGVEKHAWLGVVLLAGAVLGWWCLYRGLRGGVIGSVAGSALLFSAALAGWGLEPIDQRKSPRPLIQALPADQLDRDVRLGCFHYFQPSLVFYAQRQVALLSEEKEVREFLQSPLPAYLFVPAQVWNQIQGRVPVVCREVGRHHDLYDGQAIVVVTNE
jgi:hypothetical protein